MTTAASRPDLDTPHPLSRERTAQYRRDGFIKLKNVFDADTLETCRRAITPRVLEHDREHGMPWEQRDTYQKAFIQVMNLWRHDAAVQRFVFGKRLARIAAELMGCSGVRLYHDQALYKQPAQNKTGGHTPWHADQYYWPLDTPRTVTAWIPLHAVPQNMGPLAFAIGSQHFEKGRHLAISDESEAALSAAIDEAGFEICDAPFELGEVSFHAGWTFHRAGPNHSDQPREVMTVIYMDEGARLKAPENDNQQADWKTWLPGVKIGALCHTPINPVLWSKDD